MSDISRIQNHVQVGLALLAQQLQNSASHTGLFTTIGNEIQAIEDALFGLVQGRSLASAVGVQVDGLGAIVGEDRQGADDVPYLARIGSRILINRGSGSMETIIGALLPLLPAGNFVKVTEYKPAALIADGGFSIDGTQVSIVGKILQLAKAAGVKAQFSYSTVTAGLTATFDGAPAQSFDAGLFAGLI